MPNRITMTLLSETSHELDLANAKLQHAWSHINTHMHAHTDSMQQPGHMFIDGSSSTFRATFW